MIRSTDPTSPMKTTFQINRRRLLAGLLLAASLPLIGCQAPNSDEKAWNVPTRFTSNAPFDRDR